MLQNLEILPQRVNIAQKSIKVAKTGVSLAAPLIQEKILLGKPPKVQGQALHA